MVRFGTPSRPDASSSTPSVTDGLCDRSTAAASHRRGEIRQRASTIMGRCGSPAQPTTEAGAMTRRNLVDPWGDLHADPARGLFTGDRGGFVDDNASMVRHHAAQRCGSLPDKFRDSRRPLEPHARPRCFLDDAVALAAGRRPCASAARRLRRVPRRGPRRRPPRAWTQPRSASSGTAGVAASHAPAAARGRRPESRAARRHRRRRRGRRACLVVPGRRAPFSFAGSAAPTLAADRRGPRADAGDLGRSRCAAASCPRSTRPPCAEGPAGRSTASWAADQVAVMPPSTTNSEPVQ